MKTVVILTAILFASISATLMVVAEKPQTIRVPVAYVESNRAKRRKAMRDAKKKR